MSKPTISEVQETLKVVEETARERLLKHSITAFACAFVSIFFVQCTDRYWNESDFVKAVKNCEVIPSVTINQVGPDPSKVLSGSELAADVIASKNDCIKAVLDFYQKTASMRPIITIDKNDVVH